jgi:hypothetical protein
MTAHRLILLAMTLIGLPAGSIAQSVPLALGPPGARRIVSVPEAGGPAVQELEGVTFGALELAGDRRIDRLRSDLPSERGTTGPAPRIDLPAGGALHRVHHAGLTSLLHVRADGVPQLMWSVPDAAGLPGLAAAVAVSPDGVSVLASTTLAAGGDVWHLRTDGGGASELTSSLPALDVEPSSLRVGADHAWFVADEDLHRAETSQPTPAAFPVSLGLPAGFAPLPEIVVNAGGAVAAVLAEDAAGDRLLVAVDAAGGAQIVTPSPGALETPGLDLPDGPRVAVSPDGTVVAWQAIVSTPLPKQELFVRRLALPVVEQVTADAQFIDTMDSVGILGFVASATLTFMVGENTPGAVADGADLFGVTVDAGGGLAAFENLTLSSGIPAPPYSAPGELEVVDVALDPRGERLLLIVDPQGADAGLLAADLGVPAPPTVYLPSLEGPPSLEPAGDHVLVSSVTVFGTTDVHLLAPAASGAFTPLGSLPPGVRLDRFTVDGAGSQLACVVHAGPAFQYPVGIDLTSATTWLYWPDPLALSETLAFTPGGDLAVGLGVVGGGPYLFVAFAGPLSGAKLGVGVADGLCLSP